MAMCKGQSQALASTAGMRHIRTVTLRARMLPTAALQNGGPQMRVASCIPVGTKKAPLLCRFQVCAVETLAEVWSSKYPKLYKGRKYEQAIEWLGERSVHFSLERGGQPQDH